MTTTQKFDVAIIGGGPAGSTAGSLIKKYDPDAKVLILEKETFPRDHVGESQLPPITAILHEMGAWEKVEAADFPIKVGATYRWGNSPELWDFEFLPLEHFKDEARPAKLEGQRLFTAFQVDRATYDHILLDHAAELGCDARQATQVRKIERTGDRIDGLILGDGTRVEADHYLDASGNAAILRRAMDVGVEVPTRLKNMAIWDYWENTDWAVEIGVGGTRVQVLSIGTGWIWFIPLGPTRTSIGYICPVEHYKNCGMTPEQLYLDALAQEPRVTELCKNAKREERLATTKDWSFVSDRMVGENWMLVGEAAGFADPILAGGMTLAHTSAREAAYIVLADRKGDHDPKWMKRSYEEVLTSRIKQYIRFADFWYAANGQFTDLEDETQAIADAAGLKMTPKEAFRWLSLGGFTHEDFFLPGLGGLDLIAVKEIARRFTGDTEQRWEMLNYNTFKLNLNQAKKATVPIYNGGTIIKADAYRRGHKQLPMVGLYGIVHNVLKQHSDAISITRAFERVAAQNPGTGVTVQQLFASLENMLLDGWVTGKMDAKKPKLQFDLTGNNFNSDEIKAASA
ncbi:MAG: NAD(P)/FAD-dependent oxidoreductase [Planctomycetota bacterium]